MFLISVAVLLVVAVIVAVIVAVTVASSKHLAGVVPSHVRKNAIFDIATEQALFGKGVCILARVHSPAHHAAQKERSLFALLNLLVEVVLEQPLRLPAD